MLLSTLSVVENIPAPVASTAAGVLTTAVGSNVTPAVVTLSGVWVGGEVFEISADTDTTTIVAATVTIVNTTNAPLSIATVLAQIVAALNPAPNLIYSVNGATLEALSTEGAIVVTLSLTDVITTGAVTIPTDPRLITVDVVDSASAITVVFRRDTLYTSPALVRRTLAKEGVSHDLEDGSTSHMLSHAIALRIQELLI